MIRKASIIGILALGMTAVADTSPVVGRFLSSARSYCAILKSKGNSLSAIERVVFSLILADTNCRASLGRQGAALEHRTT